jgi:hypothetical protein
VTSTSLATYFKFLNWNSAKCLDVGGNAVGAQLQQWSCAGNANQRFTAIDQGNGYYTLRLKQGSNACLQAASSSPWAITQQTCNVAQTNQQVSITPLYEGYPYYKIKFRNTGRCLTLPNTSNGTKVTQNACSDADTGQNFYLVE